MIIVTGGAGFIGSNLVKGLNEEGHEDILVVDDLTDGHKFKNLIDCQISDYLDKDDFLEQFNESPQQFGKISAIFHLGACSDTTEWNGRFMMKNNYEYSKQLLDVAQHLEIPFIYASSAAVYGANQQFKELPECEKPLNVYGYSKLLFDQYVRRIEPYAASQIVGLRYFNVYGPREAHKAGMASVAYHNHLQIQELGFVKLFEGHDHYGPGEQRRDFVYVDDVVKVNLWFLDHPEKSGIVNVGTGKSQTFKELSESVIQWHESGHIEYIPFPEHLKRCYQSFTEADISLLRAMGYQEQFQTVQDGVKNYLDWLKKTA
jgi:ADP-L-glycero-D-manno-heptose 6-epimerase